jgi:adenylate cyclase class 2
VAVPRSFESNVLFDTPDSRLRSEGRLLRIRSFRGTVTLTFKGPAQSHVYKSRPETELTISSKDAGILVLEGLGLSPQFIYEKYRTQYDRERSRGIVLLDETPIGTFLEIEGDPRSIDAAAKALGFRRGDYITSSYGKLYRDYCAVQKVAPANMVFDSRKRRRAVPSKIRKKLP